MFRKGGILTGPVDDRRYRRILQRVFVDIGMVMRHNDIDYSKYVVARETGRTSANDDNDNKKEGVYKCSRLVKVIAGVICGNEEQDEPFKIVFAPMRTPAVLEGFVSWLMVNRTDRLLTIVYDQHKIQSTFSDGSVAWSPALAKMFLHELGHARLHLSRFQDTGRRRSSEDEEREAWLYALTFWSILVGDFAWCARMNTEPDPGWMIC